MTSSTRLPIVLVLCAFTASGCASNPSPSAATSAPDASASPSASASPTSVRESVNGISFERPADWTRWQPNQFSPMNDGPWIYLSTDPLLRTCATTPEASPNPADAQGRACDWPLDELAPNGVLVTWLSTRILQNLPEDGEAIEVNGAPARLEITTPGECDAINADETMNLLVPIGQPTPLSNLAVLACMRGPDLATAEAKFRAMLSSATVGS